MTGAGRSDEIERMEFLLALRRRGISDQTVLRALDDVPRARFVNAGHAGDAYADHALPIACGQTISQPYVVAYMTEQLGVRAHHTVLEVGTGSGYQAAVLSRLARQVITIERYRTLAQAAKARFAALGYDNIETIHGDGFDGVPEGAPYDRILVTAAAGAIPAPLVEQLADDGGVMVLPVGPENDAQRIMRITKTPDGVREETLISVRFVPLLPGRAREL